jgi:hypothetical protein
MATKKSSGGSSKGSSKKSGAKGGKGASAAQLGLSALGENTLVATHDTDILAHITGSCHKIIGKPINLEVCYTYDASKKTVCVTVKLAGQTIGTACLSPTNTTYNVCAHVSSVKACITLTFDLTTLCLNYKADACVKIIKWICKSYKGRIACF